ncbi:MAG: TraR/DksA family transcriptional regulator [Chitinophagaceae bacterium]|nr:TraR/DksA family transcriptional regulator [Chitinophagaceae bacterium]
MATTKKKASVKTKKVASKAKAAAPKSLKKVAVKSTPKKTLTKKTAEKKSVTKKVSAKKSPSKIVSKGHSKAAKPIVKKSVLKKADSKTSKKLTKKQTSKKTEAPKASVTKKTTASKAVHKIDGHAKSESHTHKEIKSALTHHDLLKKAVKAKKVADKKKAEKEKVFRMPEITTDRSRKYDPSFTRSILDQPEDKPTGPTLRYSDADLKEFKDLIVRKLEAAKRELAYLQGLITRKDQMGGDDNDSRYMTMEDGSLSMEREQLSQMASRQIQFIDHLEKALVRIENKTYGICRVTGKLIDKARLRAVPHATLSIEAKMGINK